MNKELEIVIKEIESNFDKFNRKVKDKSMELNQIEMWKWFFKNNLDYIHYQKFVMDRIKNLTDSEFNLIEQKSIKKHKEMMFNFYKLTDSNE